METWNKVLLVEDDETTNFISSVILKSAGFEFVDGVLNGLEACRYIETKCPDLIFLDINMPIMDGWEFLDEMKSNISCKVTKVVILTSSTRPCDQKMAENYSNVVAFWEKPMTDEKIVKLKQELFK